MKNKTAKKTRYVAGLMFRNNRSEVALILKTKPAWQAGRLNAIGGKIEPGEAPMEAMIREFKEETDVYCDGWFEFCVLECTHARVHFFSCELEGAELTQTTDEMPLWANLYDPSLGIAGTYQRIPNLRWLIPMALDKDRVTAVVEDRS